MKDRFGNRLHISKSLPIFLEFSASGVTKGSGLAFLAERLGFSAGSTVAFGDGENDVELLDGPATAWRSQTLTSASAPSQTSSARRRTRRAWRRSSKPS